MYPVLFPVTGSDRESWRVWRLFHPLYAGARVLPSKDSQGENDTEQHLCLYIQVKLVLLFRNYMLLKHVIPK